MNNQAALLRGLIIGGVCLPLALFLGYQLATPEQFSSLFWVGVTFFAFLIPILLRWHHPLLIIAWNLQFLVFFLPGHPQVFIVIAALSLTISVASRMLRKDKTFISCPAVAYPLLALAVVTLATLYVRGVGAKAFGMSAWGAGRYAGVLGAIIGYFALTAQPIPPNRAKWLAALFFLSGLTAAWPDLLNFAGPGFQELLAVLPSSLGTAIATPSPLDPLERFVGFSIMATFFCYCMLMQFGIRGLLDWHRLWRLLSFAAVFAVGLLGGFRSQLGIFFILFLVQLGFERLYGTVVFSALLAVVVLTTLVVVPFSEDLPMSVQRAISFLPVKISPIVQQDATGTLDWRFSMWQRALPDVPHYLLLGKGFAFDSTDLILAGYGMQHGLADSFEDAMITDDYHQGILPVIIPLGVWGFAVFLAFCWGGFRALYANYCHGDPELLRINTFLLSLFVTQVLWYLFVYGEFYLDLMSMVGVVGLNLALNNGVKKPAPAHRAAAVQQAGEPGVKLPAMQPA
ncbi:MAG: hypothetical protein KGJ88_12730 [Verrucomicrobiota bacterium]|nr:hypothetical protein [Verrucomicrobiota bacterium]